jgi:hypothetical protein
MAVLLGSIGALPVGLKGKLYGQPFKVLVQYDAFGGVRTQIYENEDNGSLITEIRGDISEKKSKGDILSNWAYSRYSKENKDSYPFNSAADYAIKNRDSIKKDLQKKSQDLIKNLVDETISFNKGKDTKTYKPKNTVNIAPKKAIVRKPKVAAKPQYKTINVKDYCVKAHTRRMRIGSPFLY